MTKRTRRNHSPAFKAKVALAAIMGVFLLTFMAAWFPGGATISRPYSIELPHPLRTGRALLKHPAPSYHLSTQSYHSQSALAIRGYQILELHWASQGLPG